MAVRRDQLLELEHLGWRSLCNGTGADFYGTVMTQDAQMILANGTVMGRSEVTEALRDAPPWSSYDIDDATLVPIGDAVAGLVYTGTGRRDDGDDFIAVMTSVYAKDASGWRLALYQQTPKP